MKPTSGSLLGGQLLTIHGANLIPDERAHADPHEPPVQVLVGGQPCDPPAPPHMAVAATPRRHAGRADSAGRLTPSGCGRLASQVPAGGVGQARTLLREWGQQGTCAKKTNTPTSTRKDPVPPTFRG